jgi:hypothetical protein
MKRIIHTLILIFLITIASCSTEDDLFRSTGKITGIDVRECSCCGGFYIEIDNTTFRFYDLPKNSRLNLDNPTFPIYVKLDWTNDANACLGDEIIVSRIEKR